MSIEEYYMPVAHKHANCPICHNLTLIHDVTPVRSPLDKLIASIRNIDADVRIMKGKRITIWHE